MEENTISIKLIDRNDNHHDLIAPTDMNLNVMEVLKSYEFPIEGTCGGMALCASCHCYILSDHELTKASEDEEEMLDQAFLVEDNSRLSCQIKIRKELDGIAIKLAPIVA